MGINENKICFIICVNDTLFFDECIKYINWLEKPEGIEIELVEVREAASMTSGYNEGMRCNDAKYKVYMHQDVFIINKYFIYDVLQIFKKDFRIGMIGLVGCLNMPKDGIMWHGERVSRGNGNVLWEKYRYELDKDGYWSVDAVDGLLMVTQYDLPWREDLFDGWDYYDISQCFEMKRKGYSIVVPLQNQDWYIHDDKGIISLWNYDKYRQMFLAEYGEEIVERNEGR
ncbi:glycosyl transferase family 2 [Kineothrix alysoides]|uniref:Glycosyl transferase family 2 n=1 Tax=Kineothrix alysoides TaxID=1469948 RepID=A0A4R1QMK5_9FIRM|nr:glycosyltransferase family protein [Kineothrix alysoides]TCL54021.1 glycosyl transferase family 2 [Kineothrix alysoides]